MPSPHDELAKVRRTLADHESRLNALEKLLALEERIKRIEIHVQRLAEEAGHVLETSGREE